MTIGFDAKRLLANRSGLGAYARTLVGNLLRHAPPAAAHLYTPRVDARVDARDVLDHPAAHLHRHRGGLAGAYWRTRGVVADLRRDGIGLYHGLSQELPVGLRAAGVRSVVTIHDLIQQRHPEQFPWFDRRVYDLKVGYAVRHADRVVAITEHTRRDVLARYPEVDPARVRVVVQSCDPLFFAPAAAEEVEAARARFGLPADYLLAVGSLVARKNHRVLLEAYARLAPAERVPLVIVGRGPEREALLARARALGLAGLLRILTDVDATRELRAVYAGAVALAYPSVVEGFGIPLVEASLQGVPVLAGDVPAMREAGGPGARYVAPRGIADWARALREVLGDAGVRAGMRREGEAHARARFGGAATAEAMREVYREALAEP